MHIRTFAAMQTSVDLLCFDGEYTFRLPMSGIIAIEQKCGTGIGEIHARTLEGRYSKDNISFGAPLEGRYRYSELIEIIRQGLIGGNSGWVDGQQIKVNSLVANHLIATYVSADKDNPVERAWELAASILFACIHGYEPAANEAQKKTKPMTADSSTAERSSETAS